MSSFVRIDVFKCAKDESTKECAGRLGRLTVHVVEVTSTP